jgi:hypothetical protein
MYAAVASGLYVCCPVAPVITDLRFTNDPSTAIAVTFSTQTDEAKEQGEFNCSDLLSINNMGVSALGENSYCVWQTPSVLVAWFGSGATVEVGDNITLASGKIYNGLFPSRGAFANQTVHTIAPPFVPPVPHLSVDAPENLNPCMPFTLDAGDSTGTGGRPLLIRWSVDNTSLTTGIAAVLGSESSTSSAVTLPASLTTVRARARVCVCCDLLLVLSPQNATLQGHTLTFTATAVNHFNVASQPVTVSTKVDLDTSAPEAVVVPANSVVQRTEAIKLTCMALPLTPACTSPLIPSDTTLEYTWTQTSGPSFNLGVTNIDTLYIAPNTLLTGDTYVFQCQVSYTVRPNLLSTAHATVFVAASPLVASIDGAYSCVVRSHVRAPHVCAAQAAIARSAWRRAWRSRSTARSRSIPTSRAWRCSTTGRSLTRWAAGPGWPTIRRSPTRRRSRFR